MGRIITKINNTIDNRQKTFNRIPQQLINEANSRISLADLIGQTVTLAQASKDQWKGLCPFHAEKTPSFFVNDTKGFYHCFGCGESGNAISFLMKAQGMPFRQSAMRVLQLAGLEAYDASEWIQSEASMICNSVAKTIHGKTEEEENDVENIRETLFHIAETCYGIVADNPKLFDKIEDFYKMIDDNYRFQNYERIYNIRHNLLKRIGEIINDSRE